MYPRHTQRKLTKKALWAILDGENEWGVLDGRYCVDKGTDKPRFPIKKGTPPIAMGLLGWFVKGQMRTRAFCWKAKLAKAAINRDINIWPHGPCFFPSWRFHLHCPFFPPIIPLLKTFKFSTTPTFFLRMCSSLPQILLTVFNFLAVLRIHHDHTPTWFVRPILC